MRTRRWRIMSAAVLSLALVLPLGARPAPASAEERQPAQAVAIDWSAIIVAGIGAISAWANSANTVEAIRQATAQILAAVTTARNDIISAIESLAVAELSGCANHAVIEFFDIEGMTADNMQKFAQEATGCAVDIVSTMSSIADKGRKDQLGFALNIVAPIALNARDRTGLSTDGLARTLRSGLNHIDAALLPECYAYVPALQEPEFPRPRPGDYIGWDLYCRDYRGYEVSNSLTFRYPDQGPTEEHWAPLRVGASAQISRAIAIAVLPVLGP